MLDDKIKTQKYFSSLTSEDIEKKLSYLIKVLPRKPSKKNYQLSKKLLKINKKVTENDLQNNLQEIADRMREHLQINRYVKILTISNVEAGKFERIDDLNCIYINGNLSVQNYQQKIAILAHEMSHYYLIYQHKIHLADTNENELLTELNAIYIGFGFLLLKGYKTFEEQKGNTIYRLRVGYIETPIVKKVIIRTAYIRKQNPIWILKNIGLVNVPYFTIKLFKLIRYYYQVKYKRITKKFSKK